ncbi:MAG: hypothetical protein WCD43_17495 [Candidatus Acidiferrales bacterium]
MTADVEALMSCREFAQNSAQIHTEAPYAERATADVYAETDSQVERADSEEPTGPFANVKLVYTPTAEATEGALPERVEREPLQRQGTALAVPYRANPSGVSTPEAALNERAEGQSPTRQGTALAVPYTAKHSGVSTPEVYTETGSQVERAAAIAPKRSHHKRKRAKRKPRPIPTLEQVTLRPGAPRKQSQPKTQTEIDLSHHERRCSICHHPEREAIEEAFLQWRKVKTINHEFHPEGGPTAIYRHARALKLFKQRNLSLRSSLEFVIEQAEHVMPSAEGLVKAIRAYTRINDQGEWIDTPTTHIVKVVPMRDPEPRNVTNSARHEEESGSVTLDVKKISNCPREGRVEVTIESPSGRPFLTGSAPQTEIDATT